MNTKKVVVPSDDTKDRLEAWFAYGKRPYEIPEEPQRTRFQGSIFDFNGKRLKEEK